MTAYERLLDALSAGGVTIRAGRAEQTVKCPAHEDKTASLSIGQGRKAAVVYCHAGCTADAVLAAVGLTTADLSDEQKSGDSWWHPELGEATRTYPYDDEDGNELFRVARFQQPGGKTFRQGHRRADGRKRWSIKGIRRVPYRLPELIAAVTAGDTVYIVEGEKDADRLHSEGLPSTTNPMGTDEWPKCDSSSLNGANVVVIQDNDQPGRDHATEVAEDLAPRATVRVLGLPGLPAGGDVSDWLDNGGTVDELLALVEETPEWTGPSGYDPATAPPLAVVLVAVDRFLSQFMHFESVQQRYAVVLWIAATYVFDAYDVTPYLDIKSPEKRSGKTLLLEILNQLCRKPLPVANMSPAALYRVVEKLKPSLLLDEIDAVFGSRGDPTKEELRGLLNAGYRKGAVVYRSNQKGDLLEFSPFCPKAFAGIGDRLPDTVADRSIPIALQRKPRNVSVSRFRLREVSPIGAEVAQTLAHALTGKTDEISRMKPDLPDELNDREQDTWELLFAVADLAGGVWPERARAAALRLSLESQNATETLGEHLLADLREVWGDDEPAISTKVLLERLHDLEEAPWGDWYGRPIEARFLAQKLKPYGVTSTKVKHDGQSLKGYRWEHLAPVWDRYVPTEAAPLGELGEPREPSLHSKDSAVPHDGEPKGNPADSSPSVPPGFPTEPPYGTTEVPRVPQVPHTAQERVTDREATTTAKRDFLTRSGASKEDAREIWDATCEDLGYPSDEPLTRDELAEIRRVLDFEESP